MENKTKIELTREKLDKLHELNAQIIQSQEYSSELLRTAQDRHNNRKHKLEREGKEIELTEKVLWEEVFYIGSASQAGKILAKEHPEVFSAYKRQEEIAAELKKFTILEFGIDYSALTLSDYLKMTEALFKLLLDEHERLHAIL